VAQAIGGFPGWGIYSSFRYYEVQILMIKLLWCGHLARTRYTSLKLNLLYLQMRLLIWRWLIDERSLVSPLNCHAAAHQLTQLLEAYGMW